MSQNPRPILKNDSRRPSLKVSSIRWDEDNLEVNENEKVPRMKIDEPKTPYHKSSSPGAYSDNDEDDFITNDGPSIKFEEFSTNHCEDIPDEPLSKSSFSSNRKAHYNMGEKLKHRQNVADESSDSTEDDFVVASPSRPRRVSFGPTSTGDVLSFASYQDRVGTPLQSLDENAPVSIFTPLSPGCTNLDDQPSFSTKRRVSFVGDSTERYHCHRTQAASPGALASYRKMLNEPTPPTSPQFSPNFPPNEPPTTSFCITRDDQEQPSLDSVTRHKSFVSRRNSHMLAEKSLNSELMAQVDTAVYEVLTIPSVDDAADLATPKSVVDIAKKRAFEIKRRSLNTREAPLNITALDSDDDEAYDIEIESIPASHHCSTLMEEAHEENENLHAHNPLDQSGVEAIESNLRHKAFDSRRKLHYAKEAPVNASAMADDDEVPMEVVEISFDDALKKETEKEQSWVTSAVDRQKHAVFEMKRKRQIKLEQPVNIAVLGDDDDEDEDDGFEKNIADNAISQPFSASMNENYTDDYEVEEISLANAIKRRESLSSEQMKKAEAFRHRRRSMEVREGVALHHQPSDDSSEDDSSGVTPQLNTTSVDNQLLFAEAAPEIIVISDVNCTPYRPASRARKSSLFTNPNDPNHL